MFTKIYYVNLDRRPDRKENVISELKKINYNGKVERISAIDGTLFDIKYISDKLITQKGKDYASGKIITTDRSNMTKGGIGCALSHAIILKKILEGGDEYALILEDDIWFAEDFNNKLKKVINSVKNYDILWIGHHNRNYVSKGNIVNIPSKIWGTFGYIVNKKAALELLNVFPITLQVDNEMPKCFNKLKVYSVKEDDQLVLSEHSLASFRFGSDIQTRPIDMTVKATIKTISKENISKENISKENIPNKSLALFLHKK